MDMIEQVKQRASEKLQRIIFPESREERVLKAVSRLQSEKIAKPILIGCRQQIERIASECDADINGIEVRDPDHDTETETYSKKLLELRKHKGMTEEKARELVKDPVHFGMMMVKSGHAEGLVSGATHSTADTLRPALQILKTREGYRIASSFFLMITGKGPFLFADCAINIEPDAEELAMIAENTAQSSNMFGMEPRVALLSFSSKGSGKHESVDKIAEAASILKKKDIISDGELQVDAAIVPEVASLKVKDSPLGGKANILIFPDLNSGNIGYKLVERLGDAQAIGPIMQGIDGAVNDLSRGCSEEDIVNVGAITALQAIELDGQKGQ
ncbi:MAG: phosphate acetyltransferase [Candidatus Woesearchaeota archaeon]